jgi:small subunit ribosomal protein S9
MQKKKEEEKIKKVKKPEKKIESEEKTKKPLEKKDVLTHKKEEKKEIIKKEEAIKEEKISPEIVEEAFEGEERLLAAKPSKYWEAVGRRKTSIARVRLFTKGEKALMVNEKEFKVYFPTVELQEAAISPLKKMKCIDRFSMTAIIKGGGIHSQAEAVKHGISRALVVFNPDFQKRLRRAGFLTRDSRMKERKKFGLKRARRAPQWQKR